MERYLRRKLMFADHDNKPIERPGAIVNLALMPERNMIEKVSTLYLTFKLKLTIVNDSKMKASNFQYKYYSNSINSSLY